MSQDELITRIFASSAPLRRLDDHLLPTGIASGCLLDYGGKRLLLTVEHATGDQKNWAIEIGYEKGKGAKCYQLGAMNFLLRGTISTGNVDKIDFSYVEVPRDLVAYRQKLDPSGNVMAEMPVEVFHTDTFIVPSKDERYGFAGHVKPNLQKQSSQTALMTEFKVYHDLSFVKKEDHFYIFKLPMKYSGHADFKGCSGAPIIDTKGNVVALVCKGNAGSDEIYGIALKDYQIPLDILAGKIM